MTLITPESTLRESVAIMLRRLSDSFGPSIKLTLVARHVTDEKAFAVFSEDPHLEKVIETLNQQIKLKDKTFDLAQANKELPKKFNGG